MIGEAKESTSLLAPALVAAIVSGVVSLTTLWISGRRTQQDRQRQLFADAYKATVTYREFAFIVRRRRKANEPEDRARITSALSQVQMDLSSFEARVRVEAPWVARHYSELVAASRLIAGRLISSGWDQPASDDPKSVHVRDVDFSPLKPYEDACLRAVKYHLRLGPTWMWRALAWLGRKSLSLFPRSEPPAKPDSEPPGEEAESAVQTE
jgi:hypothetical protein